MSDISDKLNYNNMEKLEARRDGATLVPNSGRGARKGDARLGNLLIDYKFTDKASYALNRDTFNKHDKDAFREQLEPVIVVVFDNINRRAIVDWNFLMYLTEEVEELRSSNEDLREEAWRYRELCK